MNRRCYVHVILMILHSVNCQMRNWLYSKSWIEDYRVNVKYGLPAQNAPTEYSIETHKIGIVQREDEKSLDEGGYDYRESSTALKSMKKFALQNKGNKFTGHLLSELITVPENVSHVLPSLRVDMILLEKISEDTANFIGLLESPKNDGYSSFSSSLRNAKKNSSISWEFILCGNYERRDMLSIGYMQVHYNNINLQSNKYVMQEAAVIDPYLFMVVVKSLAINGTSLATCNDLNVRGALFDNTVPGIYLPFAIYKKFIAVVDAHANKHGFPIEMKIWERKSRVCFKEPVNWKDIPEMRIEFFAKENEAIEVSYSGESLVKRYYTKNSGTTYCYIFAIRKGNNERLIFGRAAFEGVRLIFNRSRKAISFLDNSCCGPTVHLRRVTETKEKMSLCLPKYLRSTKSDLDSYWIWILVGATVLAILTCLLSVPRTLDRFSVGPPTIHIFIPEAETVPCGRSCQEKSTDTTE